jgi:hypothetical protein
MDVSSGKSQLCFLIAAIIPVGWSFGEPTNEELLAKIKALEQRLSQVEANDGNHPTKAEVDATVKRVLEDELPACPHAVRPRW